MDVSWRRLIALAAVKVLRQQPAPSSRSHVFQYQLITPNGQRTPKPHPSGLILPGMQKPECSWNGWGRAPLEILREPGLEAKPAHADWVCTVQTAASSTDAGSGVLVCCTP